MYTYIKYYTRRDQSLLQQYKESNDQANQLAAVEITCIMESLPKLGINISCIKLDQRAQQGYN